MSFNEFIENYKTIVAKKYFCFDGRADRKEFWMFFLANFVIFFVLGFIPFIGQIVGALLGIALLCPSLGLTARRLHDTGKSGWLQLLQLIPGIGGLIVLILCIPEGQKEANAYGEPVAAAPCCCCEGKNAEEQK